MMRTRPIKIGLVVLSLIVSVATLAAMYQKNGIRRSATAAADCGAWDQAASQRVATLISDDTAAADFRLDAALAQLRRARKYCRSGFATVAESDYRALERAIPVDQTASITRTPQ